MSATTRRTALTALAGAAAPAFSVTAIASAYGALGMPGPPQHGGQPVTNIRNGVEPTLARMARQAKPLHSASSRPPPSSRPCRRRSPRRRSSKAMCEKRSNPAPRIRPHV
jgi:hypothetical protein